MQIKVVNVEPGIVEVTWDAATVPPTARQIQFRSLLNVQNTAVGYDIIATTESVRLGKTRLNVPSGILLEIAAATLDTAFHDVEGVDVVAIIPL